MKIFLPVCIFVVVVIIGAVTVSVWNECRQTNSALYCFRLVSR